METRSTVEELWLFDAPPTFWSTCAAKPPTYQNIYLHFRYLLEEEGNSGLPAVRKKAELTGSRVKEWWKRAVTEEHIITMDGIIFKIQGLHKEYINLFKQRKKETDPAKKNREAFTKKMASTFMVVKEEGLSEEDAAYVQDMKNARVGTLGSVDTKLQKANKNKERRDKQDEQRIE